MSQVRCIEAARGSLSAIRLLFTTTVFTSAFLLFSIQPMFAKMVLPLFGSSPAVWNTCMVFFQAALLAGYAGVHATTTTLRGPRQTTIHLAVLAAAIFVLPVAVPAPGGSASPERPVLSLLGLLLVALGAPFFALSAIGPLVQGWFARSRDPLAGDPYFLYASSNLGSLVALVSYPTLVEPNLRLAEQGRLWSIGYLLVAGLVAACALTIRLSDGVTRAESHPGSAPDNRGVAPTALERGRWLLLAFIPSSLALGLTTYLTTDVAPMPLLWVIPLATYLVSFVFTFARTVRVPPEVAGRLLPVVAVPVAVTMATGSVGGFGVLVSLHLAALLLVSLLCHGELARSRPAPDRLTDFYLWLGLGGVLGGLFNAVVAPTIFSGVAEYPLVLVLACLVRRSAGSNSPGVGRRPRHLFLTILVVTTIFAALLLPPRMPRLADLPVLATVGVPAALCFALRRRSLSFALGLAALLAAPAINLLASGETAYRERSFFGVSQVRIYPRERLALLLSGTTNHGAQSLDAARRREPLSYYHRTGPIGQIFAALPAPLAAKVGIIGLGTGSLACYGGPAQQFTFYEIDPAVIRIARDTGYFTFLRICPPEIRIVLGDARLSLAAAADAYYGLLVLDAFSGDAIPGHLLTREALVLYEHKLAAPGLLAIHISNNHLDLEPALANLAHDARLLAVARFDERVGPDEARAGKTPSHWVVLARRPEDLRGLADDPRWHPLAPRPDKTLWTDDFSNLLEVIRWR